VEIGISRGGFQVVRLQPTADIPDGQFVLRVEDADSGITVVIGLNNEAAAAIRQGLEVPEKGPSVHLADPADVRAFGKQGDGSAERTHEWVRPDD
jgi:hypothetical protein